MNLLKSMRIFVFVFAILFFCGFGNTASAQGGDGKIDTNKTKPAVETKPAVKTKASKIVPKSNKPTTSKNNKKSDPPVADWEINNMIGRWTGRYNEVACTLEVERFEGDTFYGKMFWGEGFEIAITGVVERNTRIVTLTETKVIRLNPNGVWRLHVNTGTLPYSGLSMKGTGRDGKYTYKWSFDKVIN